MKMLWRLSREAIRYKALYIIAILSTLGLTGVNLAAPKALSAMTGESLRSFRDAQYTPDRIVVALAGSLTRQDAEAFAALVGEKDAALLTGENCPYVLKFRLIELWELLREKIAKMGKE